MKRLIAAVTVVLSIGAWGQAYPTGGALTRTGMVEYNNERGTIFSIDVDGREYWITAKHILTGAKHPPIGSVGKKSVTVHFLDPNSDQEHWVPLTFSVIDPGPDIDIVALAPSYAILQNAIPSPSTDFAGVTLGGDCEFLGFPFGGGWRATWEGGKHYWMPYVKHCTVSSLPAGPIMILDGINNPGFSGGPVLYNTGPNQKIVAVISGYQSEPAEVITSAASRPKVIKPPAKPLQSVAVNVNSGFIIAYTISPVIDAIKKNPIGPLRPPPNAAR